MQRNLTQYQKRRLCECVTMTCALSTFTVFTLYIVFVHGIAVFGARNPFNVVEPLQQTRNGIHRMEVKFTNINININIFVMGYVSVMNTIYEVYV